MTVCTVMKLAPMKTISIHHKALTTLFQINVSTLIKIFCKLLQHAWWEMHISSIYTFRSQQWHVKGLLWLMSVCVCVPYEAVLLF